jgi:eukaryotic-like serine/threonine-protein kinase
LIAIYALAACLPLTSCVVFNKMIAASPPNIRDLFDAVADLPEAEQEAALRALTTDAALIEKVLRLCGHARDNATRFSSAIAHHVADLSAQLSEEMEAGDVLGTWKLIEKIGEGGMGSVFLAERTDGVFEQQVAIKVIHGLPTESAKARLSQERQILAGLTHPNIARLFDGGSTPSGQPYLVMELIEGVALDAYCVAKKATFLDVLTLMQPICETVAVAHQRLIVHCDIKPANILVTTAGRPILLDFGIASLLGQGGDQAGIAEGDAPATTDGKLARTVIAHSGAAIAYTPRYASPEQKAGKTITTASDIFSLGKVLEELCLNDAAFAARAGTANFIAPQHLKMRETRAIIAKACNELPNLRYSSVANMADDIKRVINAENVNAAAEIAGYRPRKWVGRYAVALVAGTGFVAMATGFSLRLFEEKKIAQQQAIAAVAERDNASAAKRVAETASQAAIAARQQAESARAQAEAAQAETLAAKNDAEKQRDSAVASDKQAQIARQQAQDLEGLEKVAKFRALEAEKEALIERDRVASAQKSTAKVNAFLVSIFDGVNPVKGGDRNASARDVILKAEGRLKELEGVDPEAQASLFRSLIDLHLALGEPTRAIFYLERELQVLSLAGDSTIGARITALSRISTLRQNANLPGARSVAEEAVQLAKTRVKTHPIAYATALMSLSIILTADRRYVEAERVLETAEAVWQSVKGDHWKNSQYRIFRANVARSARRLGKYNLAVAEFKKSIALHLLQSPVDERRMAFEEIFLANMLAEQGETDEAEALYITTIERVETKLGEGAATLRSVLRDYAFMLREANRFSDARSVLERVDLLLKKHATAGEESTSQTIAWANLAEAQGNYQEALQLNLKLVQTAEKTTDQASVYGLRAGNTIARLHLKLGDIKAARVVAEATYSVAMRDFAKNEESALSTESEFAGIEAAEGNILHAANRLNGIAANYSEASPFFHRYIHTLAAKAWQRVATAIAKGESLGVLNPPNTLPLLSVPASDALIAQAHPVTVTRAQAMAIARDHAQLAFDIAGKITGIKSANYKSGKALLATLSALH